MAEGIQRFTINFLFGRYCFDPLLIGEASTTEPQVFLIRKEGIVEHGGNVQWGWPP